jgi:hypothetical protein
MMVQPYAKFLLELKTGGQMDDILTIVAERLFDDSLDPDKLHYCIRAMFETITNEPVGTCTELNQRMQALGWNNFAIDDHTFKLVMLTLKKA